MTDFLRLLDIFGFNVYVRYKDMDTYFPMKALIIFYHAENLLRHFFKTLCAYKDIDLLSDVQYLFRALCEWTTFTFC